MWNRHTIPIPTPIPISTIPTPIPIPITTIPTPIPTPPKLTTNDSDSGIGVGIAPGLEQRPTEKEMEGQHVQGAMKK